MKKVTLPITKAIALAADSGFDELVEAVAEAMSQGWDVVEIEVTETGDNVMISPPSGAMVGWFLPDHIADSLTVIGGTSDLHLTVAYLGDAADLSLTQQRLLIGVVSEVVARTETLFGKTTTLDVFENDDGRFWHVRADVEGIEALRSEIVAALKAADLPVSEKFAEFIPHITLGQLDDDQELPELKLTQQLFMIDTLTVAIGGNRFDLKLLPVDYDRWNAYCDANRTTEDEWTNSAFVPIVKSVVVEAQRFTLGPLYVPDTIDAHGDWADADTLQRALWDFVQRAVDRSDNSIKLQHQPMISAGRFVEAMCWPFAVEVPVIDVNGNVAAHAYPAGTPFLGVIWEPWAWELLLSGEITGYSIGGMVGRVEQDAPITDLFIQQ